MGPVGLHTLALAVVGFAVIRAVRADARQDVAEIAPTHKEIDEAGARDLHALDIGAGEVHALGKKLRNLSGRQTERLGGDHRRVGGEIAVGGVGGGFDGKGGGGNGGDDFIRYRASHGRHDDFSDLSVYFIDGIGHLVNQSFLSFRSAP